MHKKIIVFIIMLISLTGCMRLNHNTDDIINNVFSNHREYSNTVSNGYKFYIPLGVRQVSDKEYNQVFNINGINVYLYVDTISYYYKNILNYNDSTNYNYYFKKFNYNNLDGYIGINKNDSDYFVKMVYNYSKVEFYSDYDNIDSIIASMLIIQKSIKFNDILIADTLENKTTTKGEINYQLDGPQGNDFNRYLEEFIPKEDNEVELPTDE